MFVNSLQNNKLLANKQIVSQLVKNMKNPLQITKSKLKYLSR